MSTELNPIAGAYLARGTIGDVGTPGAPIVHFALVVTPGNHKVTGTVAVTQAVQNGNYSGPVTGTIYATGLGPYTQVVTLKGGVHSDGIMPLELKFDAFMSIDKDWKGIGGFDYGHVHVSGVPVQLSTQ